MSHVTEVDGQSHKLKGNVSYVTCNTLLAVERGGTLYMVVRVLQCKVKIKLSLCVTKHHAMKMYGGVEV
jgi:hypothetical protein